MDGNKIKVIGVNWASSRFQYELRQAYNGLNNEDFKILMTHNPSHWNAKVTDAYNDIDLTLSGHTRITIRDRYWRF